MMARFPFRFKLLAAMMLVACLIIVGALYVTNQNVAATYSEHFEKISLGEARHFQSVQAVRREPFLSLGQSLASRVRLLAVLRHLNASEDSEELKEATSQVYLTLEDEVKLLHPSGDESEGELFFRVLDARGQPVKPPAGIDAGFGRTLANAELTEALQQFSPLVTNGTFQTTAYLTVPHGKEIRLVQTIFTLFWDRNTDEVQGAIIMGFPIELEQQNYSSLKTAIYISESLFGATLSPAFESDLNKTLSASRLGPVGEVILQSGGANYFANYRRLPQETGFPPAWQVTAHSMSAAESQKTRLTRTLIVVGTIGLTAALLLSLLLAAGLASPIRTLVRGTEEVQKGNFSVKLPITSRDELGHLTSSFNSMAEGLLQRDKLRNVLNMVADKTVAEELIAGKVALGGETRHISVLFCDIRGFTALTENMKPSEVIEMLNEHMTALTKVVYANHGVVDKFVGDLIMAIFGAPKNYGNDAFNAAQCAWQMIEERETLNKTSRYQIRMGIGIATGEAVAGCMGSADRLNYTVLGERVNLAARLCSKAPAMQVIVDEDTKIALANSFETEMLEPMQLKGFSGNVNAYRLVRQNLHSS